jgi:hypothetical protein
MRTKEKLTPAQVAEECEMLAQHTIDTTGDRESASLYMTPCHAIRHLLRTLDRLNKRVHSGYDFNADPDGMTLEVGDLLAGKEAILDGDRIDWLDENRANLVSLTEKWSEENVLWWQVQKGKKSLSGHPEALIRVAIDNAILGDSNRFPKPTP